MMGALCMKTVVRVFAYGRRYPWMAAGTLVCAIFSTAMVVVFPKVTQLVIDEVRAGRGERLVWLVLVAAAAFLVRDVFNALRIVLNNTFEQKVIFDLRSDPDELTDLAGDPMHAARIGEMRTKLADFLRRARD